MQRQYINKCAFEEVCEGLGIEVGDTGIILDAARNLGFVHYVGHLQGIRGISELENLIFNPKWVKTPAYQIIWAERHSFNGVISLEFIENVVLPEHRASPTGSTLFEQQPFTAEDRRRVLGLMVACELIFPLEERGARLQYFVPDYLKSRVVTGPPDGDHVWERRFEWLHEADFARLLGRLRKTVEHDPTAVHRNEITYKPDPRTDVTVRLHVPRTDRSRYGDDTPGSIVYVAVKGRKSIEEAQRHLQIVADKLSDILVERYPQRDKWLLLERGKVPLRREVARGVPDYTVIAVAIYKAVERHLGKEAFGRLKNYKDLLVTALSIKDIIEGEDLMEANVKFYLENEERVKQFAKYCRDAGLKARWRGKRRGRQAPSLANLDGQRSDEDNSQENQRD